MNFDKKVRRAKRLGITAAIIAVFWLVLAVQVALAGNPHNTDVDVRQSNDMNNQTSGDVNIAGDSVSVAGDNSRSVGFGHALGDVDIAQCLGSEQWGTPIISKQRLVLNWPCMAEFYLRNNKPELAAMAICNTEVVKEFESEQQCEDAHQFLTISTEPAFTEEHFDEEQEYHDEQMELYIDLQEKIAMLEEEINKPAPAPRVVRETVVEQKPLLTDEQINALRIKK
jgi:hypothetical protein